MHPAVEFTRDIPYDPLALLLVQSKVLTTIYCGLIPAMTAGKGAKRALRQAPRRRCGSGREINSLWARPRRIRGQRR